MDIIEKSRALSALIEKKMRLESTLDYMRKEAMINQTVAKYEWKYYSTASECVKNELDRTIAEIERIEKE